MTRQRRRPPRDVQEFEEYVQRAETRFTAATRPEIVRLLLRTGNDVGGSSATSAPARAMQSSRKPPR